MENKQKVYPFFPRTNTAKKGPKAGKQEKIQSTFCYGEKDLGKVERRAENKRAQ